MIKFEYKGYVTEFPNWTKHHKELSVRAKRVHEDGREEYSNDEIKEILKDESLKLKGKQKSIHNWETGESSTVIDYYIPVYNTEYIEQNIKQYMDGSSNTKQTTKVRLTFKLDEHVLKLDYTFKGSGSYASTFYDVINGMDAIEEMIEDIVESGKPIEETGIIQGEELDYHIAVADRVGDVDSFEVDREELLKHLIGIEVYDFDMEIV